MVDVSDCALALTAGLQAQADWDYVWTTYSTGHDGGETVDGIYYCYSDEGTPVPPFPFPVSIDWSDLREPAEVTVFMGNRSASTSTSATITVTNAPNLSVRACRACVFMTFGGYAGVTVNLPGGVSASAVHRGPSGPPGHWDSQFLLINDHGTITGEFI